MFATLPTLLAATILLGLVHVLIASTLATRSRGPGWNIGNREGDAPPLTPVPLPKSTSLRPGGYSML